LYTYSSSYYLSPQDKPKEIYVLCAVCSKAHRTPHSQAPGLEEVQHLATECCVSAEGDLVLGGVEVYEDFISKEEEEQMCLQINKTPWVLSQSGRRKQVLSSSLCSSSSVFNTFYAVPV
jgi:hypothetical protein